MSLPRWVYLLGLAGLVPFLTGPSWLTFASEPVPAWLDRLWLGYVAVIAAFMAGTFWGFALPAAHGRAGAVGLLMSVVLMLGAWGSLALPLVTALYALIALFLLLLLADFWRERNLDTIPGYFVLRSLLTVGVLLALAWRLLLLSSA